MTVHERLVMGPVRVMSTCFGKVVHVPSTVTQTGV